MTLREKLIRMSRNDEFARRIREARSYYVCFACGVAIPYGAECTCRDVGGPA